MGGKIPGDAGSLSCVCCGPAAPGWAIPRWVALDWTAVRRGVALARASRRCGICPAVLPAAWPRACPARPLSLECLPGGILHPSSRFWSRLYVPRCKWQSRASQVSVHLSVLHGPCSLKTSCDTAGMSRALVFAGLDTSCPSDGHTCACRGPAEPGRWPLSIQRGACHPRHIHPRACQLCLPGTPTYSAFSRNVPAPFGLPLRV